MTEAHDKLLSKVLQEINQTASAQIRNTADLSAPTHRQEAYETLRATLSYAARLLAGRNSKPVLRTLHHLACTGGTVISKAVAAQPNVVLLSEVDPFSPLGDIYSFRPTDMIGLAKVGSRAANSETQAKLFEASIDVLTKDASVQGTYLILRDHSHSKYSYGSDIGSYPGLFALLSDSYELKSAVTVRNPIDSYISLRENGWIHFTPSTFDEYCRRMLVFIDDHTEIPIFRYEDFIMQPQEIGAALCSTLGLPFNPDFAHLMSAISLSGDSGRKGAKLELRPRREVPEELAKDIVGSPHHEKLAKRLGYPTALDAIV